MRVSSSRFSDTARLDELFDHTTIGFGPFGFMLGWMPALLLAMLWPLIAALGCVVIVILVILMAILLLLYFASQSPGPA